MIKVQRISVSGVFGSRHFLPSRVRNYLKRWERKIVGGGVLDNQNQTVSFGGGGTVGLTNPQQLRLSDETCTRSSQ